MKRYDTKIDYDQGFAYIEEIECEGGRWAESEDVDKLENQNQSLVIALKDLLAASECKELPAPHWVLAAQLQAKALLKALGGNQS